MTALPGETERPLSTLKNLQVVAFDKRLGAVDQPGGLLAEGRIFPLDRRKGSVFFFEYEAGDLARSTTRIDHIGSVKNLDQEAPLWRSDSQGRRKKLDRPAMEALHEAQGYVQPQGVSGVSGQQHGRTVVRLRGMQPDVEFTRTIADDQLAAIGILMVGDDDTELARVASGNDQKPGRGRFQDQCARR